MNRKVFMPGIEYSVIIPAYNEEKFLPHTLSVLKGAMNSIKHSGEIIVVDNNSTDQTAGIAKSFGAKVVFEGHNQISRARNAGAAQAGGEYLFFIDADTLVNPELIEEALLLLNKNKCCGGGAIIAMDRGLGTYSGFMVNLWNRISLKYSLAAGCFIFSRKDAFFETGGFSERVYASEEIWLSSNMKKWGKTRNMPFVILQNNSPLTSGRKLEDPRIVYLSLLMSLLFPFFPFCRRLCFAWYKRK